MLLELQELSRSERCIVTLLLDDQRRIKLVRKVLKGRQPIYEKLKTLEHPLLPKLLDVRFGNDSTTVLEEYIEGISIGTASLSERALTKALLELCSVLGELHKNGIVHRDIKPSNLLLAPDGHIRLIDFDAAREPKPAATQDTRFLGTAGFAPPEQYGFAQTDARADIYALGVTFRGLLGPVARKHGWKKLLGKCTALDPKDRYCSAGQLAAAVHRLRWQRYVGKPILLAVAALTAAACAFFAGSYLCDPDVREAVGAVATPYRDTVFESLNISKLQKSGSLLSAYSGDELHVYELLQAKHPGVYVSTGCADANGNLLVCAFEVHYNIRSGEYERYRFQDLLSVGEDGEPTQIDPASYGTYAQAILRVYDLNLFDEF